MRTRNRARAIKVGSKNTPHYPSAHRADQQPQSASLSGDRIQASPSSPQCRNLYYLFQGPSTFSFPPVFPFFSFKHALRTTISDRDQNSKRTADADHLSTRYGTVRALLSLPCLHALHSKARSCILCASDYVNCTPLHAF